MRKDKVRKGEVFRVRCTQEERRVIAELARQLGVNQSEAVRRAVILAGEVIRGGQAAK